MSQERYGNGKLTFENGVYTLDTGKAVYAFVVGVSYLARNKSRKSAKVLEVTEMKVQDKVLHVVSVELAGRFTQSKIENFVKSYAVPTQKRVKVKPNAPLRVKSDEPLASEALTNQLDSIEKYCQDLDSKMNTLVGLSRTYNKHVENLVALLSLALKTSNESLSEELARQVASI